MSKAVPRLINDPCCHFPLRCQRRIRHSRRGVLLYIRLEGLPGSVNLSCGLSSAIKFEGLGELEVITDAEAPPGYGAADRDVEDFAEGSGACLACIYEAVPKWRRLFGRLRSQVRAISDYQLDWAGGLAWIGLTPDQAEVAVDTLQAEGAGPEAGIYAFHDSRAAIRTCRLANTLGHATLMRASAATRAAVAGVPAGARTAGPYLRNGSAPSSILMAS